ncbi:MAG: dTDP-4-dehydrorhamnose 3,5-epimerase family protein, partial [Muribaculaceae bacterium]|nr:dTDP-4-dehydrorhamnose 3,5-epimerase family protein [Muribaculaceae bacterium]
MEVIDTEIEGVVILRPKVFEDARGYFFENFSQRVFEHEVSPIRFV